MGGWARSAVMVGVLTLVGGCLSLEAGAGPQPWPPDAVALSFYMHNASGRPYYYVIEGEHPRWEGAVEERIASAGCGPVGRDWELLVWQSPSRPAPEMEVAHQASADDFGDPDVVTLWLKIGPDGTVSTGEGVPEWWADRDAQRCP